MGFLKKLFGGSAPQDQGQYYYVRSHRTGEVIQVRIHPGNDLSYTDDFSGFFARKVVVGQKSFDRIEMELSFDKNRKLTDAQVTGGEMVDRNDYDAYLESQSAADEG